MSTAKEASVELIANSSVKPAQLYRHYKTGNLYRVLALGLLEASLEPVVMYCLVDDTSLVWVRHLSNFGGRVAVEGQLVSRFALDLIEDGG